MDTLDCSSLHKNRAEDIDFYELSALVKAIREQLESLRDKQGQVSLHSFEISERLITPLQNLDDLYTLLFKENERDLSEAQRKYLVICERLLASCYCFIRYFVVSNDNKSENDVKDNSIKYANKLAYEFYYNASYELRTPCSALKGYAEPRVLTFMGVNSSPFVPENQENFDKISYWVEELWKFINDLPDLWRAYLSEDAA